MTEYTELFKFLGQYGFPILFIVGQLQGWWYMRPHVLLLEKRISELTAQMEQTSRNEARAVAIAEQANTIAEQALGHSMSIEQKLDKLIDER